MTSSILDAAVASASSAVDWDRCTLAIIKPDAFNQTEEIVNVALEAGFTVECKLETTLDREKAEGFYAEHASRPFFPSLIDFMTSGPVSLIVLSNDSDNPQTATAAWRSLIGPTDSEVARKESPDTIRARFGKSLTNNAVHGSDSVQSAEREIRFFFPTFDPNMTAAKAKAYLMSTVAPVLSKGLVALCSATPENPVEWLAQYLLDSPEVTAKKKKIFFVLGGPGSGKGTQCAKLVDEFKFAHFSAGDLLRAEVASGSEDGLLIDGLIKEGKIVPGHITIALLKKAIQSTDCRGVLIDGFPRKLDQAGAFESKVSDFEYVLFFDCPESVMEERLLKRGETSGRTDDNIESIKKRFQTFVDTSMPVVEYYESKSKVFKFDATKSPEQVFEDVRAKIVSIAL